MKKHFWQLDLASKELFGEIGPVVGPILVGAEDHDLAIEALLAQRECRGVAGSPSTDDDDSFHGHRIPPEAPGPGNPNTCLTSPPSAFSVSRRFCCTWVGRARGAAGFRHDPRRGFDAKSTLD